MLQTTEMEVLRVCFYRLSSGMPTFTHRLLRVSRRYVLTRTDRPFPCTPLPAAKLRHATLGLILQRSADGPCRQAETCASAVRAEHSLQHSLQRSRILPSMAEQ